MLLTRMAEAAYWTGRYLERAESTARVVQVHTDAHVDLPVGEDVGWEPLVAIVGAEAAFTARYPGAGGPSDPGREQPRRSGEQRLRTSDGQGPPGVNGHSGPVAVRQDAAAAEADVMAFLLHDQDHHSSILASLGAARANLRVARPVVPRDAWEACNDLWLASCDNTSQTATREGRVHWLRRVVAGCQRITGILHGTMSRDEAMALLWIGENLERADLTTRVLDVRSDSLQPGQGDDPYELVHWMAVLRSLAAYQPFRRAMPARPHRGSTLRFLLQDDRFPRAVSACLSDARSHLKALPHTEDALDACADAAMLVASAPVAQLAFDDLGELLVDIRAALDAVHRQIDRAYFHPPVARWQPERVAS